MAGRQRGGRRRATRPRATGRRRVMTRAGLVAGSAAAAGSSIM
jgi:hypothetical protein